MVVSELYQVSLRLVNDLPWLKVVKYFDKVDSTQNRILQFLPKTGEDPTIVVAETQTKGVGREGRAWLSPVGGIWFTLALPLKNLTVAQVAPFSMVAALQLAEALKEVNNLECEVKWPNDILCGGKKLAGILLTTTTKFKKGWLLIGVGINVNNPIPSEISSIATSILLVRKQTQGRSRLIEALLAKIWTAWEGFDRTGFGPYHKAFEARMTGVGKKIQLKMGKKTIQGTMDGVDVQGNLLLKSGGAATTVQAGEIVGLPN